MDLKGLKITVIGMARSGLSAALLLKRQGACVYATDNGISGEVENNADILKAEGIECETGGHTETFIKDKDLIVISPGVDRRAPVVAWAKSYGVPVISEIELGYLFCKGRIIAVTGTNGKTTTTTLIGKIIEGAGLPVIVCGNIGNPFCGEIDRITGDHYVVMETSSFQLEWIDKFKPYISVILNISDNHMDRHSGFSEYINMKRRIFENQEAEDFLILNYEDPALREIGDPVLPRKFFFSNYREAEGAFVRDGEILLNMDGKERGICSAYDIRLKGIHNLDNVMAAVLASKIIGLSDEGIAASVRSFEPLPHRFQPVAEIGGIEFINDSKATSVDAAQKALLSLDKQVVLIAGGRDKESDFSPIKDLIRRKVRALILIGEARKKIKDSLAGATDISEAGSLEEATELAYRMAKSGDAVLLSPMCTSFDMFKDYAERGEVFISAVKSLKEKICAG